jgi:hypothetical protein
MTDKKYDIDDPKKPEYVAPQFRHDDWESFSFVGNPIKIYEVTHCNVVGQVFYDARWHIIDWHLDGSYFEGKWGHEKNLVRRKKIVVRYLCVYNKCFGVLHKAISDCKRDAIVGHQEFQGVAKITMTGDDLAIEWVEKY